MTTSSSLQHNAIESLAGSLAGRAAVVLGKGPSLRGIGRALLDGYITFGVNSVAAWHDPDHLVWLDAGTWQRHRSLVRCSRATLWTVEGNPGPTGRLNTFALAGAEGFDPPSIYHGHTSAYVALQLAWIAGCDPIWLAGIDLRSGPGGEHYWDGTRSRCEKYLDHLARMAASFTHAANAARLEGRRIYNTSPHSALTCFEKRPLPRNDNLKGNREDK